MILVSKDAVLVTKRSRSRFTDVTVHHILHIEICLRILKIIVYLCSRVTLSSGADEN